MKKSYVVKENLLNQYQVVVWWLSLKLAFKTDKTAKLVNDKPHFLLRQQLHLRVILSAIKIYWLPLFVYFYSCPNLHVN